MNKLLLVLALLLAGSGSVTAQNLKTEREVLERFLSARVNNQGVDHLVSPYANQEIQNYSVSKWKITAQKVDESKGCLFLVRATSDKKPVLWYIETRTDSFGPRIHKIIDVTEEPDSTGETAATTVTPSSLPASPSSTSASPSTAPASSTSSGSSTSASPSITPAPSTSSSSSKTVYVRGYTRKDGTYVSPHYRSKPRSRKN